MYIFSKCISEVTRFQQSEIKRAIKEHQRVLINGRDHSDTIEERLVWESAILSFDTFRDNILSISYQEVVLLLTEHDKILLFGFIWHSSEKINNPWIQVYLTCEILRRKCRGRLQPQ